YGAVAVPILHEFKPDIVHNIVNHSDAKFLFTDKHIWEHLNLDEMPAIAGAMEITDFSLLGCRNAELEHSRNIINELFGQKYPEKFTHEDLHYFAAKPDDLAVINYTSGSTGFSKGVMLPYRSLYSNLKFAIDTLNIWKSGDSSLCMLPLAHMYGLMIELIFPFVMGCHIHFLTKVPSPKILLGAFAEVRPRVVITVPLVIEKIIKSKVFPVIKKPHMKVLLALPGIKNIILKKIKAQLNAAFGGQLEELIIGGSAINKDVEQFLHKIQFPYTVGYGMTECGPLIAYEHWDKTKMHACGRCVDRMQIRVESPDPEHIAGELWVKGDNVMLGYYKNPEITAQSMRDGWFNTGDLCTIDSSGLVFIHGRSKNMILGPSGQNIYPEEIEHKINNMPYVNESIVIDDNGKIVALVHPDMDLAKKEKLSTDQLAKIMDENIAAVNKELPAYSRVASVKIYEEEFEKTPKRSIKRYLYMPQQQK
ncbi:MAG: AMP-binding protein, partial [Muribaculaceae bacterium]|nr:AMP-binding protein [Muribaculaceae bacterium]